MAQFNPCARGDLYIQALNFFFNWMLAFAAHSLQTAPLSALSVLQIGQGSRHVNALLIASITVCISECVMAIPPFK